MKNNPLDTRIVVAFESIAKSLAVMADARKDDKRQMSEVMKVVMPVLKKTAAQVGRAKR